MGIKKLMYKEIAPKEKFDLLREMLKAQKRSLLDTDITIRLLNRQKIKIGNNDATRGLAQFQLQRERIIEAMDVVEDELVETYEKLTEDEKQATRTS